MFFVHIRNALIAVLFDPPLIMLARNAMARGVLFSDKSAVENDSATG